MRLRDWALVLHGRAGLAISADRAIESRACGRAWPKYHGSAVGIAKSFPRNRTYSA